MDWFLGMTVGILVVGAGILWLIYRDFQAERRELRRDERRERRDERRDKPTPHA
jgi:hypothetical protein